MEIKFIKIPLPRFTNKTRISEGPFNTTKRLRKPKEPSNENILPFITTFNANNPNIYSTTKSSVNFVKHNNVSDFHDIKLMQSKRQPPDLKKRLTKADFGEVLSGMFNCCDKRCECCNYLLINDHHTFKNVQITPHESVQIRSFFWYVFFRIRTEYGEIRSVFTTNPGKYGSEKTPYLDTFHAVLLVN